MRRSFRASGGEIWIPVNVKGDKTMNNDIYLNLGFSRDMREQMLSPASGKILRIQNLGKFDQNASQVEGDSRTISIFMHLHNVHITAAPLDGVVKKITPEKGFFKPAFLRSCDFNTKNTIELSTEYGDIKIVQIAGFFTRKIKCEVKEGQKVRKGERIGKICFGSRVDVSIPEGFEILVKKRDKVKCRKTTIAGNNAK
jgi:phosphatidylserine decarboxylase precursor-related protein